MAGQIDDSLSPTVIKVLEEYSSAMQEDSEIENHAAGRLIQLLRTGSVPKVEDIDAALFPSDEDESQ